MINDSLAVLKTSRFVQYGDRSGSLLRLEPLPSDRHPAAVYLASLAATSRRTMKQSLEVIAITLSAGRADCRSLAWEGELKALFVACADGTTASVRDAALLTVCYAGGLRRSEAVALDLADYLPETGALTVRGGKGRKDRIVYASNGAVDALTDWISLRGSQDGPLFYPVNKGDRVTVRRLTDQSVLGIVRKRGTEAGIARFSPHDLRRSFVSDLLDAGADISTAKRLAGHSSEVTTGRYDRRGEEAKIKAAKLLHVPYVRSATSGHSIDARD